ncbi:nocturnin-like isoform X2 [Tachypleus tridentatus]|uniref:nocturnin-like isoform X2 n=1 Tax=Tachypleus tridentatus TaxID=6853 RepID=UPI003FD02265
MAELKHDTKIATTKSLLMYLVRMGSFTSTPKIMNEDKEDNDLDITEEVTREELMLKCKEELSHLPLLIKRSFHNLRGPPAPSCESEESTVDGVRPHVQESIRIMQWNVLSQTLGEKNDNFVACPKEALYWKSRRWRMLEEILTYEADILCFQEVDHFYFLRKTLEAIGYAGTFFPKPDSPCYYIKGNNGPDGCAIFYDISKFDLLKTDIRILEIYSCQSNQVMILCVFRRKSDGQEFCVATTHLKARQGALLSTVRNEQGKDLLEFIRLHHDQRPVIITGDFNAEPWEPVYRTLTTYAELRLDSAYAHLGNEHEEPPYTTWKIRVEGEVCHTLDYIFFSKDTLELLSLLVFPRGEDIGENRVPSYRYSSDHFSLVCDFNFKQYLINV